MPCGRPPFRVLHRILVYLLLYLVVLSTCRPVHLDAPINVDLDESRHRFRLWSRTPLMTSGEPFCNLVSNSP